MTAQTFRYSFTSPVGPLTAVVTGNALTTLAFASGTEPSSTTCPAHPILRQTVDELAEYFAGTRQTFEVPVAFTLGSEFDKRAWRFLRTIPYGQTTSYGRQATKMGQPTASRAVGGANGRNPIVIIVPCHRVVGADQSLTGFGGGVERKRWLLDHEARVSGNNLSLDFALVSAQ